MILWHGTSEYAALEAVKHGLQPRRETGETNWDHTVESNPEAVYLTNTYAAHFAICAMHNAPRIPDENTRIRKRIAILEIDTANLVHGRFHPDEDALEQGNRGKDGLSHLDMKARTRYYRNIAKKSEDWQRSLAILGTCAYYGPIAPRHIKRVVFFDPRGNRQIAWWMMDGLVSVMSFRICGHWHRNYVRWLFGEKIVPEDVTYPQTLTDEIRAGFEEVLANRNGVEIMDAQSLSGKISTSAI